MSSKKELGLLGEAHAVEFLQEQGCQILARNWRYLKGEIDIVVKDGDWIVFVEVKTRSTSDFGNPEEFVSPAQQKMIINTAHQFLIQNDREEEARFDIIGIIFQNENIVSVDHIKNAFYPTL